MNAPKQIHVTTSPLCPREFLLWQQQKKCNRPHSFVFLSSRDAVEYVRNMQDGTTCVEAGYLNIISLSQCTTAFKRLNHDAKKSKKHEVSSHLLRLFPFIYLFIYLFDYLFDLISFVISLQPRNHLTQIQHQPTNDTTWVAKLHAPILILIPALTLAVTLTLTPNTRTQLHSTANNSKHAHPITVYVDWYFVWRMP